MYSPTLKNIFWNTNVRKQNYNNVSQSDIVSCLVAISVYGALPGSQYQLLIGIIIATLGGVNKVSSGGYQIHFISCKKLIQITSKFHILDFVLKYLTNICNFTQWPTAVSPLQSSSKAPCRDKHRWWLKLYTSYISITMSEDNEDWPIGMRRVIIMIPSPTIVEYLIC